MNIKEEKALKEFIANINYEKCPEYLREGLFRYLNYGIRPGSFLEAILKNDAETAILHASKDSLLSIKDLILFLHNEVPSMVYGSPEKYEAWRKTLRETQISKDSGGNNEI